MNTAVAGKESIILTARETELGDSQELLAYVFVRRSLVVNAEPPFSKSISSISSFRFNFSFKRFN